MNKELKEKEKKKKKDKSFILILKFIDVIVFENWDTFTSYF